MEAHRWPWEKLLQTGFSMFIAVSLLYYVTNTGAQINLTMAKLEQTLTRLENRCDMRPPR